LKLQWNHLTTATTQTDFGDPVNGTTLVALCLYRDDDTLIRGFVIDRATQLCDGKPCWVAKSTTGYAYKDKTGVADGIVKLNFKSGTAGGGKAAGQGKNNAAKGLTSLPTGVVAQLAGNVATTVQIVTSDGLCIGATMNTVNSDDGLHYKTQKK